MVNAWGRGTCLLYTSNDKYRRFGVEVVFVGADGKNDIHYTNFSPDILDWQFLGDVYVAKQDYTSIKVSYTYCRNANLAFFDGLSLYLSLIHIYARFSVPEKKQESEAALRKSPLQEECR